MDFQWGSFLIAIMNGKGMDSNGQKPPKGKTNNIHNQAEENRVRETKLVGGNAIEQNTFNDPNKQFNDY
jgi:hypothetical protein